MTYEIYRYIFMICAVLSVLMLVIAVILFVVFKIPVVIGDITGANARKAIENIRNQNAASGEKLYKSSAVNRERGKLTDKISQSGTLMKNPTDLLGGAMATSKLETQQLQQEAQEAYSSAAETSLLSEEMFVSNETSVLAQTTVFVIEFDITYIHTDEVIV